MPNPEIAVELLTAEEQALKGLLESLSQSEDDLQGPIAKLLDYVKSGIDKQEELIKKLQKKKKLALGKSQAKSGNALEAVIGKLISSLYTGISDNEQTLQQIATKGNVIKIGGDIASIVAEPEEKEPMLRWGGQLILQMGDALPHFAQLIEVLKEIRDRLPGPPVEYKGEVPAKEAADEVKGEYTEVDDGQTDLIPEVPEQ